MGVPPGALTQDTKCSSQYLHDSIRVGEQLAQASLSVEYHILDLANISKSTHGKYIGRSQFPRFITKPISSKSRALYLYKDPELLCMSSIVP